VVGSLNRKQACLNTTTRRRNLTGIRLNLRGINAPSRSRLGNGAGRASARLHVEAYIFDVARLVDAHQALGEGFDLVL
jgi:hypothetical protein